MYKYVYTMSLATSFKKRIKFDLVNLETSDKIIAF